MKGERGVVPGLAIRVGQLHCRVAGDAYRFGRDIAALDDQRDAIFTRQNEWSVVAAATAKTAATTTAAGWRRRQIWRVDERLIPQIPIHAVDARVTRVAQVVARDLTDLITGG